MTTPLRRRARPSASADLPLQVGPANDQRGGFRRAGHWQPSAPNSNAPTCVRYRSPDQPRWTTRSSHMRNEVSVHSTSAAVSASSPWRNDLSVLLTFEITTAYDEFLATGSEGAPRVTVTPQDRKESRADAERRCTQNTLMLPCGSKTVAHAFDINGHALPSSSHMRSRGPVPIGVFCVHRLTSSALKFSL